MDWHRAIERNRDALLRVAGMLFLAAGLVLGGAIARLPRALYLDMLRMLRPAESALRRLIVIAARGVTLPAPGMRDAPPDFASFAPRSGARMPAFALHDPRKRFAECRAHHAPGAGPRLSVPGVADPAFEPAAQADGAPDAPVDATGLCRRLTALRAVLDDLPKQARRMARMLARRGPGARPPMRPGWPPGYRHRPARPVDLLLDECHSLARYALTVPDTS